VVVVEVVVVVLAVVLAVVVVVVIVVVLVVGTVVVVLLVLVVVVVVEVLEHCVVRGRHLRTKVSRSLRGLVPFAAVAFAENRAMRFCVTGTATKLPQAEPSSEPGTAAAGSLGLTKSFLSPAGGWQADRFGSV
jgi:hypothetical protein